jgi:uncharacterized SAM-binding protein YcdF (DUF218 family)
MLPRTGRKPVGDHGGGSTLLPRKPAKHGTMATLIPMPARQLTAMVLGALAWTAGAVGEENGRARASVQGRITAPDKLIGVIALGGTSERIREAGRLARQYPHLRVIVSGAEPRPSLQRLGPNIDRRRIEIETTSRNTHENAVNTTALVGPRLGDRWLLITSAWHMRRALCAFRAAGFDVEPWPVLDRAMGQKRREYYVSRERVAIAAYSVMGWCKE